VTDGADELAEQIRRQSWAAAVSRGHNGSIEVTVTDAGAAQQQIPAMIADRQLGLSRMEAGEMGLEEVFVELVAGVQP
jgi:ABC-2 type transport system ATP-binding protein